MCVWQVPPHDKDDAFIDIYERWAMATRVAIHHSMWGREAVLATYPFPRYAQHPVLPHGHNGWMMPDIAQLDRDDCARMFLMEPCLLRIGIFGSPRAERRIQWAMNTFTESRRSNVQLAVFSLNNHHVVPDDARIHAMRYTFTPAHLFHRQLASCDIFLIPIRRDLTQATHPDHDQIDLFRSQPDRPGTLTSGLPSDLIGAGRPALISPHDSPYVAEVMGLAPVYFQSTEGLIERIETLTLDEVHAAAERTKALRETYSWDTIAKEMAWLYFHYTIGHHPPSWRPLQAGEPFSETVSSAANGTPMTIS